MSARPAGANFREHLRGVKEEPLRHRHWTVCKLHYKLMHNKLVLSSLEGFRKYLGADGQEPESPGIEGDIEPPQIKEEEPKPCQQMQLLIKKEEEEQPSVEEEEYTTRSTVKGALSDWSSVQTVGWYPNPAPIGQFFRSASCDRTHSD
ncbi:uncharacterized protein LOC130931863 isoform X6 [Corythoichthys intestinalis]|uniref:uncharacterized protein LOC130931863 isoform X6 n=1 Tax=Corythoichthys intestinalis TaxID=161448 RepID=UPI0025A66A2F|nr:uncharacterized protein LOC130931863 isoform X6 [Corythoichthys intestinalis]